MGRSRTTPAYCLVPSRGAVTGRGVTTHYRSPWPIAHSGEDTGPVRRWGWEDVSPSVRPETHPTEENPDLSPTRLLVDRSPQGERGSLLFALTRGRPPPARLVGVAPGERPPTSTTGSGRHGAPGRTTHAGTSSHPLDGES